MTVSNLRLAALLVIALTDAAEAYDKQPRFTDITKHAQLDVNPQREPREPHFGTQKPHGVAIEDFDGDGLLDILLVCFGEPHVQLWRNLGNLRFADATEGSGLESFQGWGTGAAVGDYDRDGHLDVFLTSLEFEKGKQTVSPAGKQSRLFRGLGNGRFSDVTERAGALLKSPARCCAWSDVDGDGWLDLFVACPFTPSVLLRNKRDGTFAKAALKVDSGKGEQQSLGCAFGDVDDDGRDDLFVANYHSQVSSMWLNRGNFALEDAAHSSGLDRKASTVGCVFADVFNRGRLDLYVTTDSWLSGANYTEDQLRQQGHTVEPNLLYKSAGQAKFEPLPVETLGHKTLSHDAVLEDLDHDGWIDIYVGVDAIPSGNRFATHKGGNPLWTRTAGQWREVRKEWGVGCEANCVCVPAADFDNDGDLDLLLVNFYDNVVLYRNNTDDKHWLKVKPRGVRSNLDGIGAQVRLYAGQGDDRRLIATRHVQSGAGYGRSSPFEAHFGLGPHPVESYSVEVFFPATRSLAIREQVKPGERIAVAEPAEPQAQHKPSGFRRMYFAGYRLPDEAQLRFIERIRPEIVIIGTFGPPQWAEQSDPRAWLGQWREVFARLHDCGAKVVGMMELLNVGNNLKETDRWIEFYDHRWDEALLGPKPPAPAASLLELRMTPRDQQTGRDAPRGCAANRHWLAMQQALVTALINAGIDGFITHRNMFGECGCPFCHADLKPSHDHAAHGQAPRPKVAAAGPACPDCQEGFRNWLAARHDGETLAKYGINELKTHPLPALEGHYYRHDVLPTPLEMEAMRYARHAVKAAFDEVFIRHGRKLKPSLLVAQWNHLPYFDELHLDRGHIPPAAITTFAHASADERWSLPLELWGQGEDFCWYCNWGTCQNTQLEKKFVGDVTLYAKLLRSLARGRPFIINKYDFYRPRNMLAEAGGLGMLLGGLESPHRAQEDADVVARYYAFFDHHADVFAHQNGKPVSEALLVVPRTQLHQGRAEGLEMVEVAGRTMIVDHLQFDITTDDLLTETDLSVYRAAILVQDDGLPADKLQAFVQAGGKLIAIEPPTELPLAAPARFYGAQVIRGLPPHCGGTAAAAPLRQALSAAVGERRTTVEAPFTVEAHVYRQPKHLALHLVNYNHTEQAKGKSQETREAPITAEGVSMKIHLGPGEKIASIKFLDPDRADAPALNWEQKDNLLTLRTPSFLVYGVCWIAIE